MRISDPVERLTVSIISIPRDEPYLGALRPGEEVNHRGYFVRRKNRTLYPTRDRSVLIKIQTKSGVVGWGETYGLVAPRATKEIIEDVLAPFTIGCDPCDREAHYDMLYDLIRVRGYGSGFYADALAAIDIALWDIAAKQAEVSVAELIGASQRRQLPAYISGLPESTREARTSLAVSWQKQGFECFKFAAPVADDGVLLELQSLRAALGQDAKIACDFHWAHDAEEAIGVIRSMEEHDLWFAEAPVKPEDIDGLARVAANVNAPVAVGEEWRTVFDARYRVSRSACRILQPEMGHTGITQFIRIAALAEAHDLQLMPHATIGLGVFLAASLQVSAVLPSVRSHEFQHSVFEKNLRYVQTSMACKNGYYNVPGGTGLGVEPDESLLAEFIEN